MDNVKVITLRPELQWFAEKMEETLQANDWKNGWKVMSSEEILERLEEELDELGVAMFSIQPSARDIIKEATDVANFAMFIAYIMKLNQIKTE